MSADDADQIQQQDARLQAAELAGVLHALGQQQQGADPHRSSTA